MIIVLLAPGEGPCAGSRLLARRLEAQVPGLTVQVQDLRLGIGDPDASYQMATAVGPLSGVAATLLDQEPALIILPTPVRIMPLIMELGSRLHSLAPSVPLVLCGAEASRRRQEFLGASWVDAVPEAPVETTLPRLLASRLGLGTPAVPRPASIPPGDLDRLMTLSQRWAMPILIRAPLDDDPSLPSDPAGSCPSLDMAEAEALLRPLLRGGARVRLSDRQICGDSTFLKKLLGGLDSGLCAHLELEMPAMVLDEGLTRDLCRLELGRLRLSLSGLGTPPVEMGHWLARLGEAGVGVSGVLGLGEVPFGVPPELWTTCQRWLAVGLEHLTIRPLQAPVGSRRRRQATAQGLAFADTPPYEILAHPSLPPAELRRWQRLADALRTVEQALAGTGILRALAMTHGPELLDLLEGLADENAQDSDDAGACSGWPTEDHRLTERVVQELRRRGLLDLGQLTDEVKLVRAPGLCLRWLPDNRRVITDEDTGKTAHLGRGTLRLLDRLDEPRLPGSVMKTMLSLAAPERRAVLQRDLGRTLDKLTSMGFVVPASPSLPWTSEALDHAFVSLDEFDYHLRLLMDQRRGEAFREAIRRTVRPGQRVVEVGTGTGILAIWAAQAGAQVCAIERYSVIHMARELASRCGVLDRIEFVLGRADLVQLDQPGDLLLSELVGDRILNEGLLEITLDARRRLLRRGAGVLPQRLHIHAQLGWSDRYGPESLDLEALGASYGVVLGPLQTWLDRLRDSGRLVWDQTEGDLDFSPVSREVWATTLDLSTVEQASFADRVVLPLTQDGQVNAVRLAFCLELCPGVELSTLSSAQPNHWSRPVFMLPRSMPGRSGEACTLEVSYGQGGENRLRIELCTSS